jgi:hypothetical protein
MLQFHPAVPDVAILSILRASCPEAIGVDVPPEFDAVLLAPLENLFFRCSAAAAAALRRSSCSCMENGF